MKKIKKLLLLLTSVSILLSGCSGKEYNYNYSDSNISCETNEEYVTISTLENVIMFNTASQDKSYVSAAKTVEGPMDCDQLAEINDAFKEQLKSKYQLSKMNKSFSKSWKDTSSVKNEYSLIGEDNETFTVKVKALNNTKETIFCVALISDKTIKEESDALNTVFDSLTFVVE